jgi:transposase
VSVVSTAVKPTNVLVSKHADHLSVRSMRDRGVGRSTLADWVGGCSRLLEPLVEAARRYGMATGKLHADDTPAPVLAVGQGKTKTVAYGATFA